MVSPLVVYMEEKWDVLVERYVLGCVNAIEEQNRTVNYSVIVTEKFTRYLQS